MAILCIRHVVHEMASTSQVMRVVLKVPAAPLDKFRVIDQLQTGALASEVLDALEHLGALLDIGAIGSPEHARWEFVHRRN